MKTLDNVLEAIGWTPLVRLHRSVEGLAPEILVKVEYMNPGGSTKDRIAVRMVEAAERAGLLRPGGTIIEATAGNTGTGLALVAAVRGYRCICVMPDKMSADKMRLLRAYGAEVVVTPTTVPPDSPESYNGVADRLAREIAGAWRPNQFGNMANPDAHYTSTGPEIWEQTEGRITAFVGGAGTGGSLSGVGKYLKERNPAIRIVGADIEGSVLSGDSPKPWKVEGIGEDFVPKTLNAHVIDEWIRVTDAESFTTARRVARLDGLLLGGSCGTGLAAALKYARRCTPDDVIVVLAPDTGRNYLSKMYDDRWMAENGYTEQAPEKTTLEDVLRVLDREGSIIYFTPDDTVDHAMRALREHGISQVPVVENGRMVGAVEEVTLLRALHTGAVKHGLRLREIMARPLPALDAATVLEEAYRLLMAGHPAVVSTRNGQVAGILTRTDLMNFYERFPRKAATE
ncbi:MAG: cystathionine beta-synthase [Candidatus Sumerlaeia bacterium]|nr:cystathionine beta-synthase [Candidatus Sumerlaeia bacterium]